MRQMLRERRIYLIENYGKVFSLKDAIELTSQKYGVSEHAIHIDWDRRSKWLEGLVSFRESETVLKELIVDLRRIMKDAEILRLTADNSNASLGALRLAADIRLELFGIFVEMGVHQDLEERVQKIEERVEKNHEPT